MFIINHRINNLTDLENIPNNQGIEVDVRYHENQLILNHDPFGHHHEVSTKLIVVMIKIISIVVKVRGVEGDPPGTSPSFFSDDSDDLNIHFFRNKIYLSLL